MFSKILVVVGLFASIAFAQDYPFVEVREKYQALRKEYVANVQAIRNTVKDKLGPVENEINANETELQKCETFSCREPILAKIAELKKQKQEIEDTIGGDLAKLAIEFVPRAQDLVITGFITEFLAMAARDPKLSNFTFDQSSVCHTGNYNGNSAWPASSMTCREIVTQFKMYGKYYHSVVALGLAKTWWLVDEKEGTIDADKELATLDDIFSRETKYIMAYVVPWAILTGYQTERNGWSDVIVNEKEFIYRLLSPFWVGFRLNWLESN